MHHALSLPASSLQTCRCPGARRATVLPQPAPRAPICARQVQPSRLHKNAATTSTSGSTAADTATQPHGDSLEERRAFQLEDTRRFLEVEQGRIFSKGEVTRSRYSPNIKFEDPITAYSDVDGYEFNIRMLRTVFKVDYKLHSMDITGDNEITARWTMSMQFNLLPWRPTLVFTGRTFYGVDTDSGLIFSHVDQWDALEHNQYLSLEGAMYVLRQFLSLQQTPNLETPTYTVLKKLKDYEVRYYPSFLVAETKLPSGAGPASGTGFTDLAGYIFGDNAEQVKMEMTTPVLSTVAPDGTESKAMQFVMEGRFKEVGQLPTPRDPRVVNKQQEGGYLAAITFSGWPLDYEVVQEERKLRDMLLRDGLKPKPGYQLARYNEPTQLPALRRNEVLIELQDFKWP